MVSRAFSSSSCSLKAATAILLVVLIIHIIGFAIPKWVNVEFTINTRDSPLAPTESGYHAGLWQHCGCASVLSSGVCLCFSRTNDPAWFKMVQAAETLGLIALIISVFLSLILMCYKQNKKYKTINLLLVIVSGGLMLIGVIVFGIKTKEGLDKLGNYSDVVEFKRGYGELSYAFILCVVAGCLCIVVCVPLYLKDMRSPIPETSHEAPVHYTARSQIVNPPQGYVQGGQPLVQYAPTHTQAQYGPPPVYVQYYQPDNRGIPYKS